MNHCRRDQHARQDRRARSARLDQRRPGPSGVLRHRSTRLPRRRRKSWKAPASDDLLVANADDDRVMRHAATFAGRVRTFGIDRPADVRALAVKDLGVDGTAALVRTPAGDAEIQTPLPGTANLANVLAATAVALRFDVPLSDIVERAAVLKPVARRGEVIRTRRRHDRRRFVQLQSEGAVAARSR